jgi:dynein heavy chain
MQGQRILTEWKDLFFKTKLQIEDEQGVERWDFQPTAITEHIKHMIDILDGLVNVTDILKRFLIFLGPNLKAVTGNSKDIDGLVAKVK